LLEGRETIAVLRVGDEIRDVWLTDDPTTNLKCKSDDATIECRFWDGRSAPASTGNDT
jgi:hypothetical protein